VTTSPESDLDARERRLRADFEAARATLNRAQGNFDRIANELRDLRYERREREKKEQQQ
jgi:hypothetical protein